MSRIRSRHLVVVGLVVGLLALGAGVSNADAVKPAVGLTLQGGELVVKGTGFSTAGVVDVVATVPNGVGKTTVKGSNAGSFVVRFRATAGLGGLVSVVATDRATATSVTSQGRLPVSTAVPSSEAPQLFSKESAFNTPIATNAAIDPRSESIVAAWLAPQPFYANTMDWGRTFYRSSASDPVFNVGVDMSPQWGSDPFATPVTATQGSASCNPLHIPADARIPTGTDRWVIIEDSTKPGLYCELWATTNENGNWHASFGSVYDTAGNGTDRVGGGGTGAGMSALAGLITFADIKAGAINHAVVFPGACNAPTFVAPATKSDGTCTTAPVMSTGMRFQLDPTFDCSTIAVKIENMICIALQKYGAINGDMTGESGTIANSLYFQTDDPTDPARAGTKDPGNPARTGGLYAQVGLTRDYQPFSSLPMNRLRLLASR